MDILEVQHRQFPDCAWLLDLCSDHSRLHKGPRVECDRDWFFEGAWSGDFNRDTLSTAIFRCGSGAIVSGRTVTFWPPSHLLENIYCLKTARGGWLVSNSFACLVAAYCPLANAITKALGGIVARARTLRSGLKNYDRLLFEENGWCLYRIAFFPFVLSSAHETPEELEPPREPPICGYPDYVRSIEAVAGKVVENARSSLRKSPFAQLVTSCSSGYDSTACAVIARNLGCRQAVTLTTGRGGHPDSGEGVADALGLRCFASPRFATNIEVKDQRKHRVDASRLAIEGHIVDFLSSLTAPADAVFHAFAPFLRGSVFFSGFHGDKVWSLGGVGDQIVRGDNSGSGLDEMRKRLGFVHVPIPFIFARQANAIGVIANSDEMAPWRMNVKYDRPIPRRLAEEAGVPRPLFGTKKFAASSLFENLEPVRLRSVMTIAARYSRALNHEGFREACE